MHRRVGVGQPRGDPRGDPQRHVDRQGAPLLQEAPQRAAVDEVHGEVPVVPGLPQVGHRDDVGVAEPRGDPRLPLKRPQERRAVRQLAVEDLERHHPPEPFGAVLLGLVDGPGAADGQHLEQRVGADAVPLDGGQRLLRELARAQPLHLGRLVVAALQTLGRVPHRADGGGRGGAEGQVRLGRRGEQPLQRIERSEHPLEVPSVSSGVRLLPQRRDRLQRVGRTERVHGPLPGRPAGPFEPGEGGVVHRTSTPGRDEVGEDAGDQGITERSPGLPALPAGRAPEPQPAQGGGSPQGGPLDLGGRVDGVGRRVPPEHGDELDDAPDVRRQARQPRRHQRLLQGSGGDRLQPRRVDEQAPAGATQHALRPQVLEAADEHQRVARGPQHERLELRRERVDAEPAAEQRPSVAGAQPRDRHRASFGAHRQPLSAGLVLRAVGAHRDDDAEHRLLQLIQQPLEIRDERRPQPLRAVDQPDQGSGPVVQLRRPLPRPLARRDGRVDGGANHRADGGARAIHQLAPATVDPEPTQDVRRPVHDPQAPGPHLARQVIEQGGLAAARRAGHQRQGRPRGVDRLLQDGPDARQRRLEAEELAGLLRRRSGVTERRSPDPGVAGQRGRVARPADRRRPHEGAHPVIDQRGVGAGLAAQPQRPIPRLGPPGAETEADQDAILRRLGHHDASDLDGGVAVDVAEDPERHAGDDGVPSDAVHLEAQPLDPIPQVPHVVRRRDEVAGRLVDARVVEGDGEPHRRAGVPRGQGVRSLRRWEGVGEIDRRVSVQHPRRREERRVGGRPGRAQGGAEAQSPGEPLVERHRDLAGGLVTHVGEGRDHVAGARREQRGGQRSAAAAVEHDERGERRGAAHGGQVRRPQVAVRASDPGPVARVLGRLLRRVDVRGDVHDVGRPEGHAEVVHEQLPGPRAGTQPHGAQRSVHRVDLAPGVGQVAGGIAEHDGLGRARGRLRGQVAGGRGDRHLPPDRVALEPRPLPVVEPLPRDLHRPAPQPEPERAPHRSAQDAPKLRRDQHVVQRLADRDPGGPVRRRRLALGRHLADQPLEFIDAGAEPRRRHAAARLGSAPASTAAIRHLQDQAVPLGPYV